ncbi:uncharacterized protein A4U43_C07F34940 [Asparagus officinalis]|uniref:RING-type domain-containing protein n=1 Tax=Asparagus officinalis TaxID=4686 RepID=A0A5P1EHL4_ASPOF|nr:uncharacterized protein A4U43_C07F34940 [Asparagus officinalis]
MTCPLCKKLLRDATTIYECLHTFCRKCILEKLTDEEVDCCPICNIDLGCVPVEKLRPDHSLQDVRAKIFPFKRRKVNAPEVAEAITLPVRRKERSLSSIVVNTPRVPTHSGLTGRRTKVMTRRASSLRGRSPLIDEPIKKEGNNVDDHIENSSSAETLIKMTQNKRQGSSNAEPSNETINSDLENGGESFSDKPDLWKPLNCLVEAANRTRGLKSGPPSPVIKAEQSNDHDNEVDLRKGKMKDYPKKLRVLGDKNVDGSGPIPPAVKTRRRRRRRDLGTSTQALIDAALATRARRICPIWLSLVPSSDPQRDLTLPQNSACYLRIKDGNLPVSFIQKYLVKKFSLSNETEVEIECQCERVDPASSLLSLADIWLRNKQIQRTQICTE